MLLVFSCLSLLLPSCSHEKGGNISNMDGTKTAKSIETEQTASSPEVEELKKLKPEDPAEGNPGKRTAADYTLLTVEHTSIWNSDYMPFEAQGFASIGVYNADDNPLPQ